MSSSRRDRVRRQAMLRRVGRIEGAQIIGQEPETRDCEAIVFLNLFPGETTSVRAVCAGIIRTSSAAKRDVAIEEEVPRSPRITESTLLRAGDRSEMAERHGHGHCANRGREEMHRVDKAIPTRH